MMQSFTDMFQLISVNEPLIIMVENDIFKKLNLVFIVCLKGPEDPGVSVCQVANLTLLCPPGLQPARLLCAWNSPGMNTGVGCHFLLQDVTGEDSNSYGPGSPQTFIHAWDLSCSYKEYQGSCLTE